MLTSVYRRGLLLVYSCMVFGDTSESIDEVMSPRFFIVYTPSLRTANQDKL